MVDLTLNLTSSSKPVAITAKINKTIPTEREKEKCLIGVKIDPALAVFEFTFHEIFVVTMIIN